MSRFTQVEAAIEECQFLVDTTGVSHSIVEVKGWMYIYVTRWIIDADSILETINPGEEE